MTCASPGSFSDYVEESFLKHLLQIASWTPPANLYAALGTAPTDTGITELSGKGYKRVKITFASLSTDVNGFSSVKNNSCLRFGPASEDWSSVNTLGIFDAASGGNFISWGPLETNWSVKEDETFVIAAGDVEAGINEYSSTSRWTKYLQELTLSFVYLGQTFTAPSLYAAIMHDTPVFDVANTALDEPTDTAYGRPLISPWGTPVQEVTGEATSANSSGGSFGTATADWITTSKDQRGLAFCDTANKSDGSGKVLMFCNTTVSQFIHTGETVEISASGGPIKIGLQ